MSVNGNIFIDNVLSGFTLTAKKTKYIAEQESVKTTVYIPIIAQQVGVDASVGFDSKANSSAHTNFDFEGLSDSGSVWYTP